MAQLFLDLMAFGDIGIDFEESARRATRQAPNRPTAGDTHCASALSSLVQFPLPMAFREQVIQNLFLGRQKLGLKQLMRYVPLSFRPRVSVDLLGAAIPEQNHALGIDRK